MKHFKIFLLLCALLPFALQAQTAAPRQVLPVAPAPPRPTDYLSPAFHQTRREALRAKMPPQKCGRRLRGSRPQPGQRH